ncbi:hypothetical protein NKJ35_24150 [Mesorhizobium sp. M0136]|uniref:hypothetical protein n=1 Tax=Mesorhizobium sp. M0136 TaxID=2956890 RepID=UPI003336DE97
MANLVHVKLADSGHRMPHPFNPSVDFPAEGLTVDREDPAWLQLINDGSLIIDKPIEAPASAGKRKEKN